MIYREYEEKEDNTGAKDQILEIFQRLYALTISTEIKA